MLKSMGLRRVAHDWSAEQLLWVSGPLGRVGAAAWDARVLPAPTMFPRDPCGHKSPPSTPNPTDPAGTQDRTTISGRDTGMSWLLSFQQMQFLFIRKLKAGTSLPKAKRAEMCFPKICSV